MPGMDCPAWSEASATVTSCVFARVGAIADAAGAAGRPAPDEACMSENPEFTHGRAGAHGAGLALGLTKGTGSRVRSRDRGTLGLPWRAGPRQAHRPGDDGRADDVVARRRHDPEFGGGGTDHRSAKGALVAAVVAGGRARFGGIAAGRASRVAYRHDDPGDRLKGPLRIGGRRQGPSDAGERQDGRQERGKCTPDRQGPQGCHALKRNGAGNGVKRVPDAVRDRATLLPVSGVIPRIEAPSGTTGGAASQRPSSLSRSAGNRCRPGTVSPPRSGPALPPRCRTVRPFS